MALQWFLRATSTQIVAHPTNECPKEDKVNKVKMLSCLDEDRERSVNGKNQCLSSGFQMPLHYPRYKKEDYEKMEDWRLDLLLREYGLSFDGSLEEKRAYAMGAFLWPSQR